MTSRFKQLMGNGRQWGIKLEYAKENQKESQALLIGAEFISGDNVALILAITFFYAKNLEKCSAEASAHDSGRDNLRLLCEQPDGLWNSIIDQRGEPCKIIENLLSDSNYAVTGLYFYDNSVLEIQKTKAFSQR